MSSNIERRPLIMPASPPPRPANARRSRTPEEEIAHGYVAIAKVHALRATTEYAIDAVAAVDRRRQAVVTELPEIDQLLAGLEVNMVRLLAGVQNSLLTDDVQVIL